MPIYEHECLVCGERFEIRRSMSDRDSEVKCQVCGAEKTHRILSVFSAKSTGSSCAPGAPT